MQVLEYNNRVVGKDGVGGVWYKLKKVPSGAGVLYAFQPKTLIKGMPSHVNQSSRVMFLLGFHHRKRSSVV